MTYYLWNWVALTHARMIMTRRAGWSVWGVA